MGLKFQYDLAAIKFPERLAKNLNFARVLSLTKTALDVRKGAIQKMQDVFDRPTRWTLGSLKVVPATKNDPIAYVDEQDGPYDAADHILGPHIRSGTRGRRSSEHKLGEWVVTGKGMKVNQYGNLPATTYTKILSQLKVGFEGSRATNSKRSKRSRKNEAYFKQGNVIYQRKGKTILPALILTRPPNYRKTFPYFETGQATFDRVFPNHFNPAVERAIQAAIRNSGFR